MDLNHFGSFTLFVPTTKSTLYGFYLGFYIAWVKSNSSFRRRFIQHIHDNIVKHFNFFVDVLCRKWYVHPVYLRHVHACLKQFGFQVSLCLTLFVGCGTFSLDLGMRKMHWWSERPIGGKWQAGSSKLFIIMRCFSEWRTIPDKQRKIYLARMGFEPATFGLLVRCSTNWATGQVGSWSSNDGTWAIWYFETDSSFFHI